MDNIQSPKNNPVDVYAKGLISAINGLMQTPEVCKRDRAVMKLNRMKQYVMSLQDEITAERADIDAPDTTKEN